MIQLRGLKLNELHLTTIGVYGFTEEGFFSALDRASVDTFCDIRRRRGLRGSKYAFANSRRLQDRLRAMNIRYLHFRDLSPTEEVRNLQRDADKETGVAKRDRLGLSEAFVQAYVSQCLSGFNSKEFVKQLGSDARVVAMFCVEQNPEACHRYLLAKRINRDLGFAVEHITP